MLAIVLLGISLLALLVGLYLVRKDYIVARDSVKDNCENFFQGQKSGTFVEGLSQETKAVDIVDAKTVKEITESVASEQEVLKLLEPVFKLINKESKKGNFSVYIHGMDWYYGTNIKYSKAITKLKDMGYRTVYRPAMTGITIKWD